ncbi:MAG: extracellular solute-binding protein [Firmicutes bacterium]|nr:extracellular solute-binding protein [Bacillota bacterium]
MTGNLEKITKGDEHVGQPCIVCQEAIDPNNEVVLCPRCRSLHHVDCWKAKGGCGKTGCPQIAQAVKGEKPAGDGPPPPVSKWVILGGILAAIALILYLIFRPTPPDPAMGRTKIVFLGEAHYELTNSMTELADSWNETNEEIYIDLQLLPTGALDQKLVVLIAAGDAPDLIALSDDRFAYFVEQQALLPLTEDEYGEQVFGIQHPAQLSQLVVWRQTEHPTEALEVLHYFVENIPPADLDLLREVTSRPLPLFGL